MYNCSITGKKIQRSAHKLNKTMYLSYTKCCGANLYPTGALIQVEALKIKERMVEAVEELDGFHTSNRWLESFRMSYKVWQTTTKRAGEADDASITTVKALMEKLPELIKGYLPEDILNMDELGLFFKTLPQKGLAENGTKGQGGKQNKKRCTIALFVCANGSKVCEPIVKWRSKKPRCFRNLTSISRPYGVHYFANTKTWMTTEIMQKVL